MFCLLSFVPLIQIIWSLRLSQELNINSECFIDTDVHALQINSITLITKQTAIYISHYTVINKFIFMFCWPCISIHPCNENQLDPLFILSSFRQSTYTCFGHICSPSSGCILYIYNRWYMLCFSVDCLLAGQQTVYWKAQHIPIVVYIQYTSWWWATNMPETCSGWLTK